MSFLVKASEELSVTSTLSTNYATEVTLRIGGPSTIPMLTSADVTVNRR